MWCSACLGRVGHYRGVGVQRQFVSVSRGGLFCRGRSSSGVLVPSSILTGRRIISSSEAAYPFIPSVDSTHELPVSSVKAGAIVSALSIWANSG